MRLWRNQGRIVTEQVFLKRVGGNRLATLSLAAEAVPSIPRPERKMSAASNTAQQFSGARNLRASVGTAS